MESTVPCSSCDKSLQEFFKVFLPQKGSALLQIPTSFTKFFNGITPCKATLVDHDRKSWDVYLEKIEGRLVFKNGWQQFAREKSLEEGDFLVFQYDGMATFNVKIFLKTGCRKVAAPAPAPARKRKHTLPSLKINDKSVLECQLCPPCPSEGARCKSVGVCEENDKKKPDLTKCVLLQNPHFQIYFDSPWKLERVEIPKRLLTNIKLIPKIRLRDENGKLWPMTIITAGKNHRHYLGRGWHDFKLSNNIQLGYRCDFQFVLDKENVAQELLVRATSEIIVLT